MKRLLYLTLVVPCAAIVVAGCGNVGLSTSLKASLKTLPPAAVSPRQRAEADAAAIRASFVPPPGARRLTAAPGYADGVLGQSPLMTSDPDLVDDASWWQVPGQPQAVLAWEQAHLPGRFTNAGSGSSGEGVSTAWNEQFSLPAVPAALDSRELIVEVVGAGPGQTAIRADSQVTWLPPKPEAEKIPVGAQSVTIRAVPGSMDGKPPAPVVITNRATVRRIAALADGLPVFPPGTYSCPMDTGRGLELTFRGAGDRIPAVVDAELTGCGTVSFTVGGQSMPTLWGGSSFAQQVIAVARLHWQVSS